MIKVIMKYYDGRSYENFNRKTMMAVHDGTSNKRSWWKFWWKINMKEILLWKFWSMNIMEVLMKD